jgi:hypothetical protein
MNRRRTIPLLYLLLFLTTTLWFGSCTKQPTAPPEYGKINVNSYPSGAEIWLDGKSTGKTTQVVLDATVGYHAIKLKLPQYIDWEGSVDVQKDQTEYVYANLLAGFGSVRITSVPPGAHIFLDAVDKQMITPAVIDSIRAGYHGIRLELTNYSNWSDYRSISADDTTEVNAVMYPVCPGNIIGDLNQPATISIVGLVPGAGSVRGFANNINAQETKVVLWALTNMWYVQPWIAAPYTRVCGDGSWSNSTHPWQRLVALLVNSTYVPGSTRTSHPSIDPGVIAWTEYPPSRPDLPLMFANYQWTIKVSGDRFDPGPNYWSDSVNNVWVDSEGLHLKIKYQNNKWTCSEVSLLRSLGYGEYTFQVASRVDNLDARCVAAPFLYESTSRELDIEFAGDALIPNAVNAQYVVQPYTTSGNMNRFIMPAISTSTHRIIWRADRVEFASWSGHGPAPGNVGDFINHWVYTGSDNPPPGGERLHFNVWLFGGTAPNSSIGDEMIIRSFTFTP